MNGSCAKEEMMDELQRHRLTFKILVPVISAFLKIRFNYEYDDLSKIEGPYILVANHNMELDPASVGVAVKHQIYFVASEHITRKGLGTWFLMTFFKPILHQKGRQGVNTVKQMLKTLRDGHSVCIFPEGNRSFNGLTGEMLPAIGKMARSSGAKLVTFRLEGGYLTQPRWSMTWRRGKLRGRLIHEYSREELKAMTNEQVNEAICTDLFEDAYETQKKERIAYRGKKLALGMEAALFVCPKCGQIGALHSDDRHLYCECGFQAIYDVYGELTDTEGRKYTITELDRIQREVLNAYKEKHGITEALFADQVTLYEISEEHTIIRSENGCLTAYADRVEFNDRIIRYDEMQGMAIYSRNFLTLHRPGETGHLEIKADERFCALKYLYLYETKEKGE